MIYGLVNINISPLMKEPSIHSERVDEALYGMKVQILKEVSSDWVYVRTHYQYEGYVLKSQLIIDKDKVDEWDKNEKAVVLHPFVDVLGLPKVQGYYKIGLARGAIVAPIGNTDENGYLEVQLCDGSVGYMKSRFLREYITTWSQDEEDSLRKALVDSAFAYLGTQYRWGGKTSLGIDCSGLCSMAYLLNGVIIYRDAMIKEGFPVHEIPYEDMKMGDLMFFPGHMAMYIGESYYIHATAKNGSDGVVINSLDPEDEDYREDLPKTLIGVGSIFTN